MDGATKRLARTASTPDAAIAALQKAIREALGDVVLITRTSRLLDAANVWFDAYKDSHPLAAPGTLAQYSRCIRSTLKGRLARRAPV